jgi:hypothetical protein
MGCKIWLKNNAKTLPYSLIKKLRRKFKQILVKNEIYNIFSWNFYILLLSKI